MIKLNKKAAENTAISSTAKNVSVKPETFKLSDKIRFLYRFIKLSRLNKCSILVAINSLYNFQNDIQYQTLL